MILNIIVLILEVMYYSLFLKYAKREGKLWQYILSFIIVSIVGLFIKTNYLVSYLILVLLITLCLKYISKIKIKIYDILVIMIMIFIKSIIEHIVVLIFFTFLSKGIILTTFIFTIVKFIFVLSMRNKISKAYNSLLQKWNNNNFYIRYLFTIIMFVYIIISVITILFY